jgi:gliding motility-associated-like protein
MKYCFFIILLFSETLHLKAQSIYYSSISHHTGDTALAAIGLFDIQMCAKSELYIDTTLLSIGYYEWIDIALSPEGKLYGLGHDGIYLIDLVNQTQIKVLNGPGPPNHRWFSGMICTKDTVLIFGERDLFSYDINSHGLIHHGRLPGPMNVWGDIFWLNGNLYSTTNLKVVQIDLANPSNSQFYCDLSTSGYISFTEVAISCDSVAIIGLKADGELYLINQVDCSATYYCSLPRSRNETFQGSSPTFMFMPPQPCTIHVDLDQADLTMPGIDFEDTLYCQLPSTYIFSNPDLFSDKPWDSLMVWIEDGPAGVYLDGNSPAFATLTGAQSNQVGIYATTSIELSDLSPVLKDLRLGGQMPNGTSTLKIGYCAWADYLVSDTAYAYITLIGRTTTAGEDAGLILCPSDPPYSLSALLSSEATPGGRWAPLTSPAGTFNPVRDPNGLYQYIVMDPVCEPDTSDFSIELFAAPVFDLGPDRLLCPGDTVRLSVNLANVDILWSTGSELPAIHILEPQPVSVELFDPFGCRYTDSTEVLLDEDCLVEGIYIPNIFSPDGNGINDDWAIDNIPGIINMELSVFDRWGNVLYQQEGENISWNGLSKQSTLAPPGVYVYMLSLLTSNNHRIIRSGTVTLMR